MNQTWIEELKWLNALADTGLLYSSNEYDRERYQEIKEIVLRLWQSATQETMETLQATFPLVPDYPTAKVDIRGLVVSAEGKILLVQEMADRRWSLPGGWADVGFSPKEIVVKECREESGLDVVPQRLLAVFDKKMHPHPPQPFYVYKLVILCTPVGGTIQKGHDVLDVGWFAPDNLPPLSEDRILPSQVEQAYQRIRATDAPVYLD